MWTDTVSAGVFELLEVVEPVPSSWPNKTVGQELTTSQTGESIPIVRRSGASGDAIYSLNSSDFS